MLYRTDNPDEWGDGKGSNLAPAEVDGNFWEVRSAIDDLIANPLQPNEITSITTSGATWSVHMADGSVIGPLPLPVLSFRWRDDWAPYTIYLTLDTFRVQGVGIFSVLQDHTSGATFDPTMTAGDPPLPVYMQMLGTGIVMTDGADGDFLVWDATIGAWTNRPATEATALLVEFIGDTGSGGVKGLVPAPAVGDTAA